MSTPNANNIFDQHMNDLIRNSPVISKIETIYNGLTGKSISDPKVTNQEMLDVVSKATFFYKKSLVDNTVKHDKQKKNKQKPKIENALNFIPNSSLAKLASEYDKLDIQSVVSQDDLEDGVRITDLKSDDSTDDMLSSLSNVSFDDLESESDMNFWFTLVDLPFTQKFKDDLKKAYPDIAHLIV